MRWVPLHHLTFHSARFWKSFSHVWDHVFSLSAFPLGARPTSIATRCRCCVSCLRTSSRKCQFPASHRRFVLTSVCVRRQLLLSSSFRTRRRSLNEQSLVFTKICRHIEHRTTGVSFTRPSTALLPS